MSCGDGRTYAYNKDMLTVDEFKKIIQSLYDRGYVLVAELFDAEEVLDQRRPKPWG